MILKITGIVVTAFILQGIQRTCLMARRDIKQENFHGQDPKTIKFKYAQLVIFTIILWVLMVSLILSLIE